MSGQVYFIECTGRIKIGFSTNVDKRMRELATGAPTRQKLLGHIEAPRTTERALHRKLADYRHHGEWFTDCAPVRSIVNDILANGIHAVDLSSAPEVSVPAGPPRLEWWQRAAKELTALFNRYEYTIERVPRPQASIAIDLFKRANDDVERMVDRSEISDPEADAKLTAWLAGVESQVKRALRQQVRGLG